MVGIDKTKNEIVASTALIVSLIAAIKNGPGLGLVKHIQSIVGQLYVIVSNAKGLKAEFEDLDAKEKAELGQLCFESMKQIFAAAIQ